MALRMVPCRTCDIPNCGLSAEQVRVTIGARAMQMDLCENHAEPIMTAMAAARSNDAELTAGQRRVRRILEPRIRATSDTGAM
jgi:hypothetical protein